MSTLSITNLGVVVGDQEIVKGLDLEVSSGQVHAVMGPNGSGKSTLANAIMGRPGYQITSGSIELDGQDLCSLPTWQRAQMGLFLAMQYPTEVPGVSVRETLELALQARGLDQIDVASRLHEEAQSIGLRTELLERALNVDLSGGEKKRNEIFQLAMLQPKLCVLDETDSGLDIDALKVVAGGINSLKNKNRAFIVITHYQRLLDYIKPDFVHVLANGKIVKSGDFTLALDLEKHGYGGR